MAVRWIATTFPAEVAEKVAARGKEAHDQVEFRDWVPLASARRELTLKFR